MKALVFLLLCALAAGSTASGTGAWSDAAVPYTASLVNTIVQPHTKGFAYSTTQYINAVPASYTREVRAQFPYQIPVTAYAPLPGFPAYYPVGTASYIPQSSLIYPQIPIVTGKPQKPVSGTPTVPIAPTAPIAPVIPQQPSKPQQPSIPQQPSVPEQPSEPPQSPPEQAAGDADTTVVESAEFINQQQDQQRTSGAEGQPQPTPANNNPVQQPQPQMPLYLQHPQISMFGSFHQIPYLPQGFPQFLQLPQFSQHPSLPQFPSAQESVSQKPSIPKAPSNQDDSSSQQTSQQSAQPQPPASLSDSSTPQFPQLPSFPQFPPSQGDLPQLPQLPSLPQFPPSQGGTPQLPQFPSLPQFPPSQGGLPQFPQLPNLPQFPPSQGGSFLPGFPSADNTNKGINDEDTITVESAK